MTRRRLAAWIAAFLVLLTGVAMLGGHLQAEPAPTGAGEAEGMAVDRLLDRLGVTRHTAVLGWLEADGTDEDPEDPAVWTTRNGGYFHSYPLCARLGAPIETTLLRAQAMGYAPCPACCAKLGKR